MLATQSAQSYHDRCWFRLMRRKGPARAAAPPLSPTSLAPYKAPFTSGYVAIPWLLMGHVARMPVGIVCHGFVREGGLWHTHTLRALRAGGGHLRPGPQRILGNASRDSAAIAEIGASTSRRTAGVGRRSRRNSSNSYLFSLWDQRVRSTGTTTVDHHTGP